MEEEPWEALEVDDSDLRFLLQPCKRRRPDKRNPNSDTSTSSHHPLTASQISEDGERHSLPQTESTHLPPPPPPPNRIPGPAAFVQSAMHQRDLDRQNLDPRLSQGGNPVPTQDYVRKAVEDSSEFDYDFKSDAWICALQFIREVSGITYLKSITKCWSKVEKVVAVIKSSKPNGLGGLTVTLKDPTGSIAASIHPKVLTEGRLGKNIDVGTVLVLKEVTIFAPSRSAVYLNITLRNLEKVFCKDNSDCLPTNAEKFLSPGIDKELRDERADVGVMDIEMEKENSLSCNYTQQSTRQEKEALNSREGAVKKVGDIIKMATNHDKQHGGGYRTTQILPKSQTSHEESHKTGEALRQTQHAVSKAPLVEWTDEQLSQLFAGDGLEDLHASKNRTGQQECKETGPEEVLGKSQPLISKTSFPEWTDEQLCELFAGDEMDG